MVGRLVEVVARKALEQGGVQRREREIKSALKRRSKVMFLRLIPYLGIERSRGKPDSISPEQGSLS